MTFSQQTPDSFNDNVIANRSAVRQAVTNDCWTSIQRARSTADLMGLWRKARPCDQWTIVALTLTLTVWKANAVALN